MQHTPCSRQLDTGLGLNSQGWIDLGGDSLLRCVMFPFAGSVVICKGNQDSRVCDAGQFLGSVDLPKMHTGAGRLLLLRGVHVYVLQMMLLHRWCAPGTVYMTYVALQLCGRKIQITSRIAGSGRSEAKSNVLPTIDTIFCQAYGQRYRVRQEMRLRKNSCEGSWTDTVVKRKGKNYRILILLVGMVDGYYTRIDVGFSTVVSVTNRECVFV